LKTHVYHIGYTPGIRRASVFFWGCNFTCRGCLCKKEIRNYLLEDKIHLINEEPKEIVKCPDRFLDSDEVIEALTGLDLDKVLFEGQEASLDPAYPYLTEACHKRFGSCNVLCTNAYKIPSLEHTDELQVGLKAVTDSLHREYTGKSNQRVLKNFVQLHKTGLKLTASSVYIPGYIDSGETERIAEFIATIDKDIPYHILAYFKAGDNPWRRPTYDEMDEAGKIAKKHLNRVWSWRGDEEVIYPMVKIV
jgi:pyruvate formate lyase activating enzyme